MAKRHERRIPLAVPVRIRYIDGKGNHAVHTACTLNVSRYGVRLDGASFLRVARTVTVQFRGRRAEYRVSWVGDENSALRGQAGLRALDTNNYIWEIPVPPQQRDEYGEGAPHEQRAREEARETHDRRRAPRFDCDRGVQCWREGSIVPVWGSLCDLSLIGCKVNTTTPLPVGTRVRILLTLFGTKVRASGDVRADDENTMSVQFTRISQADEGKLHAVLNRLAKGDQTAPASLLESSDVVARLMQWFRKMEFLTKEEFLDILNGGSGDVLPALADLAAAPTPSGTRTL